MTLSLDASEARAQFEDQGFVVLKGVLDPELDLLPVIDEYAELLDRLAVQWSAEGKISRAYRELPFRQRLSRIALETRGGHYDHFEITLPTSNIRNDTPIHNGPAVFQLIRSPRLLNAVEIFLGPEIYANPMQHSRIKPPQSYLPEDRRLQGGPGRTSWHQDQAGATIEADATEVLTVWIPVFEATVENGCLVVAPGSHKRGLEVHCQGTVPEDRVGLDQRPLPMQPGDVLFMTKQTLHSSLPNSSDEIRWSFDLRYNKLGEPNGRAFFPGFVARSRVHPELELRDAETWASMWRETRARFAGVGNLVSARDRRWADDDPICA